MAGPKHLEQGAHNTGRDHAATARCETCEWTAGEAGTAPHLITRRARQHTAMTQHPTIVTHCERKRYTWRRWIPHT